MEMQTLTVIHEMASLSQEGKLLWEKTDFDRYEARLAEHQFRVEFIFFLRTDKTGSDRAMARLSAFGLVQDYCIGTEGYDLICEMLAIGDPAWVEWRARCLDRFAEGLRFLQNWKDQSP